MRSFLLMTGVLLAAVGAAPAQSLVADPPIASQPAQEPPAEPFTPPPYKPLRYEEEYSYLRDPNKWVDPLDDIKYIPLFGRDDWYLTLGGEIRERYEFSHDEQFGLSSPPGRRTNQDLLQRYMGLADLHAGENFRMFGQFKSDFEDGRLTGPRPEIDRNDFDFHQGFFDFILPQGESDSVTFRVGRQELAYGTGRLIDNRMAPNNMLSFDAARLLVRVDEWKVDGFWSKPVMNRPEAFDDIPDPTRSLWGFYGTHPAPMGENVIFDLYYLGAENKEASYFQSDGYELRNTLGLRIQGRPKSGWEYNYEGMWQFGNFAGGTLQAWSVATATRYNFRELPFRPRLGLRADVASGDNNPLSPTLNTFSPLYPSGAYFNLADPIGPSNIYDLHPTLDLYLTEKVTLTGDWIFFWRQSLDDGVYTLSGTPIRQLAASNARYVGDSPSFTISYAPTRHLTFLASYVHFFSGRFMDETTPGRDLDYFTTWMTYKF